MESLGPEDGACVAPRLSVVGARIFFWGISSVWGLIRGVGEDEVFLQRLQTET